MSTFTGTLAGQTYTDAALFAVELKTAGLKRPVASGKLDRGRSPAAMTVLTAPEREWLGMTVRAGNRLGQVWCLGPTPGTVAVIFADTPTEAVWRTCRELTKVASIRLAGEQPELVS